MQEATPRMLGAEGERHFADRQSIVWTSWNEQPLVVCVNVSCGSAENAGVGVCKYS